MSRVGKIPMRFDSTKLSVDKTVDIYILYFYLIPIIWLRKYSRNLEQNGVCLTLGPCKFGFLALHIVVYEVVHL